MSFACSRISYKWNHILWFFWLLSKMFLRFTNVVACINDLFLLMIERHSIAWMQYITARATDLLVTDTWIDSMLDLSWIKQLWSFLYMPVLNICFYNVSGVNIWSEIAGLWYRRRFRVGFLPKCLYHFTIFHEQWMKVPLLYNLAKIRCCSF